MKLNTLITNLLVIFLCQFTVSCGHHFSENKTSTQDDNGKVIEKSEAQKLEDLVGPGLTPEREQALRESISEEDVNTPFDYEKYGQEITLVMMAADWQNVDSIRILIEIGADPFQKDASGQDAYDYARAKAERINQERIENGEEPLDFSHVTEALDGPDPIDELNKALLMAALGDKKEEVVTLIDEGANPNCQSENGETPLMLMIIGLSQKTIRPFLFMHRQGSIEIDFSMTNQLGETARGLAKRLIAESDDPAKKRVLQGFEKFLAQLGAPE